MSVYLGMVHHNKCTICKKSFTSKRSNAHLCSVGCRQKYCCMLSIQKLTNKAFDEAGKVFTDKIQKGILDGTITIDEKKNKMIMPIPEWLSFDGVNDGKRNRKKLTNAQKKNRAFFVKELKKHRNTLYD